MSDKCAPSDEPRPLWVLDRDLRWLKKLLKERKRSDRRALKLLSVANEARFKGIIETVQRHSAWQDRMTGAMILCGFMGFTGLIALVLQILRMVKDH